MSWCFLLFATCKNKKSNPNYTVNVQFYIFFSELFLDVLNVPLCIPLGNGMAMNGWDASMSVGRKPAEASLVKDWGKQVGSKTGSDKNCGELECGLRIDGYYFLNLFGCNESF